MRKIISFSALTALLALFVTGCAGPEQKLGRGLSNTWDVVRMGEMRRSIEQTAVFGDPDTAFTTGVIHGMDRTAARVGLGMVDVVTFPFPPYEPICTEYVSASPVWPESYRPGRYSDAMFDTDTYTGYSGGDIAPFIPGSRFKVFDN